MAVMRPPWDGPPPPTILMTSLGPREGEHGLMLQRELRTILAERGAKAAEPLPRVVSAPEEQRGIFASLAAAALAASTPVTPEEKQWRWQVAAQQRSEDELKAMRAKRVVFVLTNGAGVTTQP